MDAGGGGGEGLGEVVAGHVWGEGSRLKEDV